MLLYKFDSGSHVGLIRDCLLLVEVNLYYLYEVAFTVFFYGYVLRTQGP